MSTILDTPEQINLFRLLAIQSALRMEVKTGMMRSSRGPSTLSLAQEVLRKADIEPKRTKVAVLEQYTAHMEAVKHTFHVGGVREFLMVHADHTIPLIVDDILGAYAETDTPVTQSYEVDANGEHITRDDEVCIQGRRYRIALTLEEVKD